MDQQNITISPSFLTEHFRQLWVEGEITKLIEILDSCNLKNVPEAYMICIGKAKVDEKNGEFFITEDNTQSWIGIDLSVKNIKTRFEDSIIDLIQRVDSYSVGLSMASSREDKKYFRGLVENYTRKLVKVKDEAKKFYNLKWFFKDEPSNSFIIDLKSLEERATEQAELEAIKESYETSKSAYLCDLDFSFQHAVERISKERGIMTLSVIQLDHSNGINFLQDHRAAQDDLDAIRGEHFWAENIVSSVWNSGWLAPDGKFYGCPDLSHIEFTEQIILKNEKYKLGINLDLDPSNHDSCLEKNGWIKFSCGRWFFFRTEKPTKEQYDVIINWAKKRSPGRFVFGDDYNGLTNLDIVESQRISLYGKF